MSTAYDSSSDLGSLSHLSSQLSSLGYVHPTFDLGAAFVTTTLNGNSVGGDDGDDIFDRQKQLQLQHRARDQLVRCLWTMLSDRNELHDRLERATTSLKVNAYELDRLKLRTDKDDKLRHATDKQQQALEAKLK